MLTVLNVCGREAMLLVLIMVDLHLHPLSVLNHRVDYSDTGILDSLLLLLLLLLVLLLVHSTLLLLLLPPPLLVLLPVDSMV